MNKAYEARYFFERIIFHYDAKSFIFGFAIEHLTLINDYEYGTQNNLLRHIIVEKRRIDS